MSKIILKDRAADIDWEEFRQEIINTTSIDRYETPKQKRLRMDDLEKPGNEEKWFRYYFPSYYTSDPATFHIEATQRVVNNPEWYEVRNWSREMSKSGRSMMEDLNLMFTGKKSFKLLVSSSWDNACRLLEPYKINLESNQRLINDYGKQKKTGSWETGEFTTRKGYAFRAVGPNNAPRGARNGAKRPDIIEFDDFDTDEDVLNEDTVEKRWKWANEAVIMTRSLAVPTLIRWNGNVIADDCCIVRAQEFADHVDTINLTDEDGNPSWKRITPEIIARLEKILTSAAFQKECHNNPHTEGKTFKDIKWGKCPPLEQLQFAVAYADPATSNKDITQLKKGKQNSCKAVVLMGRAGYTYYIYKVWVNNMNNQQFIDCNYESRIYVNNRTNLFNCIENNTLQDPFYQQILKPLVYARAENYGFLLSLTPDERKKPEKFFRIEANLGGINNNGHLVFNEDEKSDPHMKRAVAQFKSVSPKSRTMDAPDAAEGAKTIIDEKFNFLANGGIKTEARTRSQDKHV